ncbi:MFS transporter [Kineosporia sp. NBRC 101731]|uniref:MFS transporter n=1 Tax=Kineosporia sp. NBRC 101731 TaxID=3032199 RepID=UPI0024A1D42F|nr:MFS transporter [Kineosporia sp. NBRC 101731]GLY28132.1 MFS transporter [Kineosporia sp. NBRC 101731]
MHGTDPQEMAGPGTAMLDRRSGDPGVLFHLLLAAVMFTVNGALLSVSVLTLSLKAAQIDSGRATTVLSLVASVGAVATVVLYPLVGRLSDRTPGRFGRRRPYLLFGAVLIALGGACLAAAGTIAMLVVGYVLLSIGYVSTLVVASALVPDQVPEDRRGPSSAIVGLGTPVGAVLGLFLAQLVASDLTAMILLPSGLAAAACLAMVVLVSDRPSHRVEAPLLGLADVLSTYWVNPLRYPAFAFAWVSRLLLFLGVSAVNAYQAFYLIMVLHVSPAAVAGKIFLATVVLTAASMVTAPVATRLSERMGLRKPFVISAAVVFAVGLGLVSSAHSFGMFLLAMLVLGAGQGVYLAVDFALVTQVLPDPENPAKDLGIMNLANTLPSSLVPAVAPALLAIGSSGQNFTALFVAGTVAALLGAVAVVPIRGIR